MPKINANGVHHEYESFGCDSDPMVVLIHGMGGQLTMWPTTAFCQPLADNGYYVVRYDVRDSGLSQIMESGGDPDILAIMAARASGDVVPPPPYTARDLARDLSELIRSLGSERAHLIGLSMGGVIAQRCAMEYPDTVSSLTLISTTSHDPHLPGADPELAQKLMQVPEDMWDRDQIIDKMVRVAEVMGGSIYCADEALARKRAGENFDRFHNPPANHRQAAAIMAETDRSPQLASLVTPTLVIHGRDDRMLPPENGYQLAEVIPNSELQLIAGMGHILTESLAEDLVDLIADHLAATTTCST